MKAKEYLYEHYTKHNNWNYYPPSESTMIKIMESYAKERAKEIITETFKEWINTGDKQRG